MAIKQDQIVAIQYSASVEDETIDNNMDAAEPLFFMYGRGQMMPGLESRIADMNVGDSADLDIPSAEAYGAYDPEAVQTVPKEHLAHLDLHEGLVLQGQGDGGEPVMVVVKEITDDKVIMDHNHPMAGKDVSFSVTIKDIRDASEDELTMGVAAENQHHHHHHHEEGSGCCGGGESDKKDGGCCH
ncbi:FKBP-type peptidyl-prolyl cis-trans isomerase [sulfur-oxidizing endosymbiont of Gigantopelta aegis]|uniref:FKBP-type peptidyl-prolyl cis-trans isomerase n=1 Tax=sulfur-oxidizing endosymbiont of Gigantopelta aegis TaxID=2794934 RepID=UPI0018DBD543|nr:peptidylprolyl isomerase [sulfur-oxidizing endosymbiont of Gigantopelta aegis]